MLNYVELDAEPNELEATSQAGRVGDKTERHLPRNLRNAGIQDIGTLSLDRNPTLHPFRYTGRGGSDIRGAPELGVLIIRGPTI